MGGKAALLMVLSFSVVFLVYGNRFVWLTTDSVENLVDYYTETKAHNIAVSGANMAANELFFDGDWTAGFTNLPYNDGEINVEVKIDTSEKIVISKGEYAGAIREVRVRFKPSSFAKFAYYMDLFGGNDVFKTGDTIWGPMHTNGSLGTEGSPVFYGKATSKLGLKMNAPKDPQFYGGYESGVDIPFTFDTTGIPTAAATNGKLYPGGPQDVRLVFNSDQTVTWSIDPLMNGTWSAPVTEPLSTFAPNGVIWNNKGNLYVSGTVNGQYTIGVGISSGIGNGNVYVENDIVYRTDPIEDPKCTDMLGIVSGNSVIISPNSDNYSDVNIHASILATQGGIMIEDLSKFPPSGTLYLAGGIIGKQNQDFALLDKLGNVTNGYDLKLKYDERFMVVAPPAYPNTNTIEIVSWYE
ncbi:MAG: hypothetical protein ABFS12_01175 [Bacteroidota bacterium]